MSGQVTGVTVAHLALGGFRTRALSVDGRGPAVVHLHGFSDTADTWTAILERLASRGVRAVAVDLPGFGGADRFREGPLLPQLDSFVVDAVNRWTIDGVPPILVGNSLGGFLVLRAAPNPDVMLSGAVLVSPAGFVHSRWISALRRASSVRPVLFASMVPMSVYRWIAAHVFEYFAGGGVPLLNGSGRAFSSQFKDRSDVERVFNMVPQLLAEFEGYQHQEIAGPTLAIWGERDRLTSVEGAAKLESLLPDGSVLVASDCGHCPQLQVPDLMSAEIAAFAESCQIEV